MMGSPSQSRSLPISSPPSASAASGGGGVNYILHTVSKYDTLAGVAIKYGVEVADIKRLNGLISDIQMFALKTLQIPLPGRHPPSPTLCDGHEYETPQWPSNCKHTPWNRRHSDLFDSFQSLKLNSWSERKVSQSMSSLQGYFGQRQAAEKANDSDWAFSTSSPSSNHLLSSHHRKSKSVANGLMLGNGGLLDPLLSQEAENSSSNKWIEKLLRMRQKSEADFTSRPTEKILKEENTGSTAMSAITGKGLALRPKSAAKTVDAESADSFPSDTANGVHKSTSTPSLQDSDNATVSSLWPIFDGLPKPTSRRNKAAID
ncbi:hypothetical protein ACP275_12G056800 [Erythranthe tilingii]